jgi:AcrR family transcriptional regulator
MLLDAARAVFSRHGYFDASIQEILAEAGVSRGTFYKYFDSKKAVLGELLERFMADLSGVIVRVDVASSVPPADQLLGNIDRVVDLLYANEDLTRLLLHQAPGSDTEFDEKIRELDDRILGLIEGSLRTGIRLGLVAPGPLRLRASFVLGAIKEAIRQDLLSQTGPHEDRRVIARELLTFALHGLLIRR